MSDDERYPSEAAERFQIRLPPGLRDRIKAYAERHGRSMNTEIVRILEREFPEPWPITARVDDLLDLVETLKEGVADENIDQLNTKLYETLKGIASGRVKGVQDEIRARIKDRLSDWELEMASASQGDREMAMDEEELEGIVRSGDPAKF